MAKKKSVVEKMVDAVDHMLHPEADPEIKETEAVEMPAESVKSDYESHPKFAKFKTQELK